MLNRLLAAAIAIGSAAAAPALAHHAVNSQFDVTKTNTLTGC